MSVFQSFLFFVVMCVVLLGVGMVGAHVSWPGLSFAGEAATPAKVAPPVVALSDAAETPPRHAEYVHQLFGKSVRAHRLMRLRSSKSILFALEQPGTETEPDSIYMTALSGDDGVVTIRIAALDSRCVIVKESVLRIGPDKAVSALQAAEAAADEYEKAR